MIVSCRPITHVDTVLFSMLCRTFRVLCFGFFPPSNQKQRPQLIFNLVLFQLAGFVYISGHIFKGTQEKSKGSQTFSCQLMLIKIKSPIFTQFLFCLCVFLSVIPVSLIVLC